MPFTAIHGQFFVTGYAPDGDSIRFKADRPELWKKLRGPAVRKNAKQHVQLRIQGIDTLETHYLGYHQPLFYAEKALLYLLTKIGITHVEWDDRHSTIVRSDGPVNGFICARKTEENHRPICFLFSGQHSFQDGEPVFIDDDLLRKSINYEMIAEGLAFPLFYSGLFYDLRQCLAFESKKARQQNTGLWEKDRTTTGFELQSLSTICDEVVIFPKLFRRLIRYLGNGGHIAGFKEFLSLEPEPVCILPDNHFTHFDHIVSVHKNHLSLSNDPDELVFLECQAQTRS